jgi:hypothetical protein
MVVYDLPAAWTCMNHKKVLLALTVAIPAAFLLLCSGWYCEIPLISEGVYMQIEQAEQMMNG